MMKLLRVLLIGLGAGIIIGWKLAQEQQLQKEKAASEAFANDPEVQEIMAESRRMHNADRWLQEFEGED